MKKVKGMPYYISAILGFVFLCFSFLVAKLAGEYSSDVAGCSVDDLLLDHIPLMDVNTIHVYGATFYWILFFLYVIIQPKMIAFVSKTFSLFILIRAFFNVLTHLGPPETTLIVPDNITNFYTFTGDLFFSGHVGAPFLAALIFWDNKLLRYVNIIFSLFFSVVVLLGGIHYSIDVFSAYFISYGIYRLSQILFSKDYILFKNL
ncbi:phosphatase PAP2-related protein [Zooshikella sp. RANM57]|uniref:phosphatase PAP2-related protein n=1 Tax=Zooshikella sp. RANM57 TaxID=3425863 RepID=UPI003D6E9E39